MLSVEDAVAIVVGQCEAGGSAPERVELRRCHGRVLAEDIVAPEPLPPFRASVMDGYAVVASDGTGEFPVVGRVLAGGARSSPSRIAAGQVAYITTGAPVPDGADAVIKVEDTEGTAAGEEGPRTKGSVISDSESSVRILKGTTAGSNVRPIGFDMEKGEVLVPSRSLLSAAEVGIMASAGVASALCYPKVTIGVVSSGDELVDPCDQDRSRNLPFGSIRDANRYTLMAELERLGSFCEVVDLGIIRDDDPEKSAKLLAGVSRCHVVVSSGGVSMGTADWLKPFLEQHGSVRFGRLAMKPGKPTTYATITAGDDVRRHFFALPGNPASCLVTARLLVTVAVRCLAGLPETMVGPCIVDARTVEPLKCDPERVEYHRARLFFDGVRGIFEGHSTGPQQSSRLLSCRSANALLVLPRRKGFLATGTVVKALITDDIPPAADRPAPAARRSAAAANHGADCECCRPGELCIDAGPAAQGAGAPPKAPAATAGLLLPPMLLPEGELTVGLLTISDRASRGEYEDRSGPALETALAAVSDKYKVVLRGVVPDEKDAIQSFVRRACDEEQVALLLTSGGTGFGPRDGTPEAVREVLDREAPGLAHALLRKGLQHTPFAVLSRPVVGTRALTLVATFPGSPKAITENVEALLPFVPKVVKLMRTGLCDH